FTKHICSGRMTGPHFKTTDIIHYTGQKGTKVILNMPPRTAQDLGPGRNVEFCCCPGIPKVWVKTLYLSGIIAVLVFAYFFCKDSDSRSIIPKHVSITFNENANVNATFQSSFNQQINIQICPDKWN
ncbi:unnamed protein product, partial [Allacma fusca]